MAGRLEGKVALITGGASGMGRATVIRFLAEGAAVVVADLNEETGKQTLAEIERSGAGARARFARTDVTSEVQVQEAVELATREFGRLDVVFNNAGIVGAVGSILDTEVEDWDFTFAAVTRSVFLGIKHGGRAMRSAGVDGSIINTASVAAFSGGGGPVAYSAAKAAVINLTRAAALELAAHRIRVNAICPGAILTPLVHRGREAKLRQLFADMQPWPEAGEGHHIAAAALFLASDDAIFVTGESLVVDGGAMAKGPATWSRGPAPLFRRQPGLAAPEELGSGALFSGLDHGNTGIPSVARRWDPK
jgi:NAD(P)-dependent dehydrogenase (short-subunit alcohol dehydrogenase family)